MVRSDREGGAERVLWGFWQSPFMSLVAHVLGESELPFRYERVSPFVAGTQSDAHKARNPLGKIPSLLDSNGLVVSESQAICRYLARTYPEARRFYPCHDPVRCAEVDALNDFITFSISGPFFNWFVVGGYFPKGFRLKVEKESQIFSTWSMLMTADAVGRLIEGSQRTPFLLGSEPSLPDFHLFHVLELGRTFSELLQMPTLNLVEGNEDLRRFYEAMASRPSTREILAAQEAELPIARREFVEEFADAYEDGTLKVVRPVLQAMFGHEV